MSFSSSEVFSHFECDQLAIKVAGDSSYTRDDCVGSLEVERETKTVTKSCRGVIKKRKTKPTGNGTVTLKLHIKLALYRRLNAMTNNGLQPGVYAFDNTVSMPEASIVARVKDEDDNIMFLGYPRVKIEEINTLSIENGAEEVAEVEMKLSYMPDDYNKGEYQALATELTGSVLTENTWMTDFSSDAAQLGGTTYTVTFNANGHGTAPAAQVVVSGGAAVTPAVPTADGYVFGGWYTEAGCTNVYPFGVPVAADVSLYAKWTTV